MKRYKVSFSRIADADLVAIYDYVYSTLGNPVAAKKFVEGIMAKCQRLRIMPESGAVKLEMNGIHLRFEHFKKFTIVYSIDRDTRDVRVRRIVYSGRNMEDMLLIS